MGVRGKGNLRGLIGEWERDMCLARFQLGKGENGATLSFFLFSFFCVISLENFYVFYIHTYMYVC
jgi:hypothetical protein